MELSHVDGLRPFGSLLFIEADPISFTEAFESLSLNALVMDKHIFPFICLDKTITLAVIKPFHYAFHNPDPLSM
jgi:hypothetical protein